MQGAPNQHILIKEKKMEKSEHESLIYDSRELNYLRPEVRVFASEMERKLRLNDHKGDWRTSSVGSLFDRLDEELKEFRDTFPYNQPQALPEGADVANFCMFICSYTIDKLIKERGIKKDGRPWK